MKMRKFMLVLDLCKDEYFIPILVVLLGEERE